MQLRVDFSQVSDPKARYAEVGQTRPCTFSFAFLREDVVYPQHKQIKCRDFLNDTLVWDDENFKGSIWGYTFSGPYDKENTTLYMENSGFLPGNLHLLNDFERDLGVSLTKLEICDTNGHLVIGSHFWQLTTLHLSWYTQVLRHLTYPNLHSLEEQTNEMMVRTKGFWELPSLLMGLNLTLKRNAPSQSGMHDNNGFFTELTRGSLIKTIYNEQLEKLKKCAVSPVIASSPIPKPHENLPSPVPM